MNYDKLKKYLYILLKVLWVSLFVYLSAKFILTKGHEQYDYVIVMFFLSLPLSILSFALCYLVGLIFADFLDYKMFFEIIFGIIIILVGYWQWFILTPKIVNKIKEKIKGKQ